MPFPSSHAQLQPLVSHSMLVLRCLYTESSPGLPHACDPLPPRLQSHYWWEGWRRRNSSLITEPEFPLFSLSPLQFDVPFCPLKRGQQWTPLADLYNLLTILNFPNQSAASARFTNCSSKFSPRLLSVAHALPIFFLAAPPVPSPSASVENGQFKEVTEVVLTFVEIILIVHQRKK